MISVAQLSAGYGPLTILRDVDMEVADGACVGILGRNGVGKTTFLRCLAGVIPAQSGKVVIDGSETQGLPPSSLVRRRISFVPDDRGLFADLTVEETLKLASYGVPPRGVWCPDRLFELFPILKERLRQRAGTLSGGEQQMLSIARALTNEPKLLMLDEPSIGLSQGVLPPIIRALQSATKAGVTILLVEQDIDLALAVVDTVFIMERGTIVESTTADKLRANPEEFLRLIGVGAGVGTHRR